MPIRHLVVLEWDSNVDASHIERFTNALADLPALIDEIRTYEFGPDLGLTAGNGHFAILASFDDVAAYEVYRDHPEHRRVIEQFIAGRIASRSAAQILI
jgi:hypothetical protein